MMMDMELPMLRNAMMSQLPSQMTHTLVQVVLPKGDDLVSGAVKSKAKYFEGQPIKDDTNPILDKRVYNV